MPREAERLPYGGFRWGGVFIGGAVRDRRCPGRRNASPTDFAGCAERKRQCPGRTHRCAPTSPVGGAAFSSAVRVGSAVRRAVDNRPYGVYRRCGVFIGVAVGIGTAAGGGTPPLRILSLVRLGSALLREAERLPYGFCGWCGWDRRCPHIFAFSYLLVYIILLWLSHRRWGMPLGREFAFFPGEGRFYLFFYGLFSIIVGTRTRRDLCAVDRADHPQRLRRH